MLQNGGIKSFRSFGIDLAQKKAGLKEGKKLGYSVGFGGDSPSIFLARFGAEKSLLSFGKFGSSKVGVRGQGKSGRIDTNSYHRKVGYSVLI